ncbi:hypothetical protein [Cerasicoccus arenae]|uniref:Uncharacterized protein n=1 Tax=Cerasicoccus arenae TaxID=424488 RepID=A0A8J3GDA1_9BACT|nr:hypothetical protein [Cerasicoccus arenae]MBK1857188.1 hypothetical protein [Cerasicoccus arenae]GHB99875.1 hypothetical protein GCM10007047_15080 [Cerasicoccus arenae]
MKKIRLLLFISLLFPAISFAETKKGEFWEVGDGEGGTILIKLMPDCFARTNYSKGEHGYLGEMGYWHRAGSVTTVLYDSGWSDVIRKNEDGSFSKNGYSPTTPLDGKPSNTSPAKQVNQRPLFEPVPVEKFIGVWKLIDENGDMFYLDIKADHTARSSYAGGPEGVFGETGVWRYEGNRITIVYNSGWVNIIVYGDGKFMKYSYGPDQILAGEFNNTSSAEKVAPKEAGVTY